MLTSCVLVQAGLLGISTCYTAFLKDKWDSGSKNSHTRGQSQEEVDQVLKHKGNTE